MRFGNFFRDKGWTPYAKAGCVIVTFYLALSHIHLLFVGLGYLVRFTLPVILGLVIAYIMDPLVNLVEKTLFSGIKDKPGLKRVISVWVTVLGVVLLIVVFFVSVIPQLIQSITTFFGNFDMYSDSLQMMINGFSNMAARFNIDLASITSRADQILEEITSYISKNANNIVSKSIDFGKNIFTAVISVILAIYILFDKDKLTASLRRLLKALLPSKRYEDLSSFWGRCNSILIRYIAGDMLDGLIVGIINLVFMSIAGMDYKILISVIVGLTNLAPTFGPIAGAVIGGVILLFVNPWHALWFLVFTAILQTIDGYIIKPKLFGNTLGISSLWILASIIVFGRMFGVIGILIAIPLAAIFDIIYKEIILHGLETRREEKDLAIKEAEAKKAAAIAAQRAATEAIKAVVRKDSEIEVDVQLKEKLAADADIKNDDN